MVAKLIIEDLSIRKGKIIYSAYKFVLISLTTSLNAVRMASALCIHFFHFFHILEEEEENLKSVSRFSNPRIKYIDTYIFRIFSYKISINAE